MFPLTEDSVSRLKYEHGKHVRDMDRVERLSVPEDRQPTDGASLPVLIPNDCKPSVNNSDPSKSTNYCAAGWPACPIPLPRKIAPLATATTCPSSKPSFH